MPLRTWALTLIVAIAFGLGACNRRDEPASRQAGRAAYRASQELKRGARKAAHELRKAGKEAREGWTQAKREDRSRRGK